jgi:hypothetical protein
MSAIEVAPAQRERVLRVEQHPRQFPDQAGDCVMGVQRGVTCVTMSFVTVQLSPQATITKAKRSSAPDFVDREEVITSPTSRAR